MKTLKLVFKILFELSFKIIKIAFKRILYEVKTLFPIYSEVTSIPPVNKLNNFSL